MHPLYGYVASTKRFRSRQSFVHNNKTQREVYLDLNEKLPNYKTRKTEYVGREEQITNH